MEEQQKMIQDKMIDCRRIGMLCLFLSTFLYSGTLIPSYGNVEWKLEILSGSSLLFLVFSFFFYWRSSKLKEKL
ncbi:YrhC family protein [Sporolactobacillus shoreicorticis]|uniref:YrhC family protein n=1 Tax=Sporolactobacillus shoreicorticis TaxID=1923877 RepID=A0ABW5S6G7_9BACL|nr:YrhC family protein [Sporolactobacillus shoreicorticis]MCO7126369.1 YrhC family protein [Sporolactobacillus shoreicorticis]